MSGKIFVREKSGKCQGILKPLERGNPVIMIKANRPSGVTFFFLKKKRQCRELQKTCHLKTVAALGSNQCNQLLLLHSV